MTMEADGVKTEARAVTVTILENVGTTVVLPPEDANTYPEGSLNI